MAAWQTRSSEEVHSNPWYRVRRDEVLDDRGRPLTYNVIENRYPSVFVVPVDAAGRIILIRQYRYTIGREMWMMPAGHADGDEALVAAQRELREETGLVSDDWVRVGQFWTAVGIGSMAGEAFVARAVRLVTEERDEHESLLEQKAFAWPEVEAMTRDGRIVSSEVMAVLWLARRELEAGTINELSERISRHVKPGTGPVQDVD